MKCDAMAKKLKLIFNQTSALIIRSAIVVAISSMGYLGSKIYCQLKECCSGKWTSPNITGLQLSLQKRVFGQHLVTEIVLKAIMGHLNNKSPGKALAFSFNGLTGSGKSKIIAEHLFRKGMIY